MKNSEKIVSNGEKSKLRFYSILGHRIFLIVCLVLFMIIATVVGVFVTRLLFWLLTLIPILKIENDVAYLSSFLGGLLGIVLGFFIDAIIISRWKRLKSYQMLLGILLNELEDVESALLSLYEKRRKNGVFSISIPVLKSVVENVDNISIFYNLPRYLVFEEKGNFVREIKFIKKEIDELNRNNTEDLEKLFKRCVKLQGRIEKFRKCTDSARHREKVVK